MADTAAIAAMEKTRDIPEIGRITVGDVFGALSKGLDDYRSQPSHYAIAILIYPVIGLLIVSWTSWREMAQLIYPLLFGFALVGPIAAVVLYEISRRREKGMSTKWSEVFSIFRSPSMPSILAAGAILLAVFVAWMIAAQLIFLALYGGAPQASPLSFVSDVFTTRRGLTLIVFGNLAGLAFAVLAFCISVITFPMLLDRDIGAGAAIGASFRAVRKNPGPMLVWAIIVGTGLVVGILPLLVGLIIVLPILGHATWHLYRALVPAS